MSDMISTDEPRNGPECGSGAAHPIVGTWRAVSTSDVLEDGPTTTEPIEGRFIFTPWSRFAILYGSVDDQAGKAAAKPQYKIAYSGTWTGTDEAIELNVDFSTSPFIAKQFTRYFEIDGMTLTVKTPVHESKASPGVWKTSYLAAVREEAAAASAADIAPKSGENCP
jgi:hypothetical protein